MKRNSLDLSTTGTCLLFIVVVPLLLAVVFGVETGMIYFLWNHLVALAFPHLIHLSWLQSFVSAVILTFVGGFFTSSSSKSD